MALTHSSPAAGAPVASVGALPTSGTSPLSVTFDGSTSSDPGGTISSWHLSFGDGSPAATGQGDPPSTTATHTYTSPGTYTATLVVTGSDGLKGRSTTTIVVNQPAPSPPVAALGTSAGSGVAPLEVTFDGSKSFDPSGAIASWDLSFGDGTPDVTGTGAPPSPTSSHTYDTPGTYTATLEVKADNGLTGSGTAEVVAGSGSPSNPNVVLGVDRGSGAAPLSVSFDGSGSSDQGGKITSWDLSFGDGTPDATGTGAPPAPTATHTYDAPGTYTATLTLTDSSGNHSSGTAAVKATVPPPTARLAAAPLSSDKGIHKIQHIVIIMQENRSFDSYFGTYPGADGIPMKNGVPTVCVPDPRTGICVKPYHDPSDINLGGPHSHNNAVADIDGGKMDGFIEQAEKGAPPACGSGASCPPDNPNGSTDVMGYHTAAEIPNYWTYAKDFVLQDHMFSSENSWSLPAHLGLVSLWSAVCKNSADPMSCTSSPRPKLPTKATVYPWTDLTWLLHSKGVSWQYFVGTGGVPDCDNDAATCEATSLNPAEPGTWNPLPNFADVKEDGQLGNIVSTAKFYSEARAGTLPAVSWVIPSTAVSEHPADRVDLGQAYVTGLINSVMESPDWGSTAMFLTWDDWGGLYDHVKPPKVDADGYGLRVPGLLISPYAKQGYIDHQILSFDAYAKFIEDDFLGGERLDPATDGRPDSRPDVREKEPILGDLQHEFNFNQAPLPPQVLNSGPPWGPAGGTASGPALSTAGTAPFRVDFDGSASSAPSGSIASWDLSFGDGTPDATGTGAPPSPTTSHTYTDPGTYTATLTVTNQAGETSQSSMTITVHPAPPAVTLNASPPGGVAPVLGVSFTGTAEPATGASIASWDLSFGDGTTDATGTGSLPATLARHDYPQAGIYQATLTVTDSYGDTSRQPFTVMVTAPITASPQTAVPDGTVVISGNGYQPGETIQLTFKGQDWSTVAAGSNGAFTSRPLTPPAGTVPGDYTVGAAGESSSVYGQLTLPVYTNWPEYRFTSNGQGVNPYETTIGPSNVAQLGPAGWDIATGAPVLATPVIDDGQAYVASSNGTFQQINISTYTRFKQLTLGNAIDSTPAVINQTVYVGSENGKLYAVHTFCTGGSSDGSCSPFLTYTLGSPIESSPTVNGPDLYVGADNGTVYAIGPARNGRSVLWSYATGGAVKSSPAVSGNLVIIGSADGNLYGLNTTTGKMVFTGSTGGAITSSPAVAGGIAYVGSADGKVYAFPASCTGTCKALWSVTTGGPITSSPAVQDGTVFVGSGDGNLYAINGSTGKVDWTMPTGGAVGSSPTVANGVVYVGSDDGSVYAIATTGCAAQTCPPLWSAATGGEVTSSPIVSDGDLYVGSHDGNVYVYDLPPSKSSAPRTAKQQAATAHSPR